jgi:hypothetical protein
MRHLGPAIRAGRVAAVALALAAAVASAARPEARDSDGRPTPVRDHEFTFARAAYGSFGRRSWSTDFPKADRQFLIGVKRLTRLDAFDWEFPILLDDPELRRYPFLYAVEVGRMALSESEVVGLREYLLAGGFLLVDDFWGSYEWANFEAEMARVFPDRSIVDIPPDHPIFSTVYEIDELLQVPNVHNARYGQTWERDGYTPYCRGIFDDSGRLSMVINWNTDLGDAWEWAESPDYPLRYSTFAYQLGINAIVYGMSH